jgi:hypothetical protein
MPGDIKKMLPGAHKHILILKVKIATLLLHICHSSSTPLGLPSNLATSFTVLAVGQIYEELS